MAITYIAIATTTVGSGGASSIDFTSIPSTYTDLLILLSPRGDAANSVRSVTMQFNGNAANYSDRRLYGTGSAAASDSNVYGTDEIYIGEAASAGGTASTFSNFSIYIPNYAGSTYKSVSVDSVSEQNSTTAYAQIIAGLWSSTSAITSIKFFIQTGNFAQYTTATLYGIKNS
jgi:hypothetical protein